MEGIYINENINDREKDILNFISKNKEVTTKKIMDYSGYSVGAVGKKLRELVRSGILRRNHFKRNIYFFEVVE